MEDRFWSNRRTGTVKGFRLQGSEYLTATVAWDDGTVKEVMTIALTLWVEGRKHMEKFSLGRKHYNKKKDPKPKELPIRIGDEVQIDLARTDAKDLEDDLGEDKELSLEEAMAALCGGPGITATVVGFVHVQKGGSELECQESSCLLYRRSSHGDQRPMRIKCLTHSHADLSNKEMRYPAECADYIGREGKRVIPEAGRRPTQHRTPELRQGVQGPARSGDGLSFDLPASSRGLPAGRGMDRGDCRTGTAHVATSSGTRDRTCCSTTGSGGSIPTPAAARVSCDGRRSSPPPPTTTPRSDRRRTKPTGGGFRRSGSRRSSYSAGRIHGGSHGGSRARGSSTTSSHDRPRQGQEASPLVAEGAGHGRGAVGRLPGDATGVGNPVRNEVPRPHRPKGDEPWS